MAFGLDDIGLGAVGKVSDLLGKIADKIWPDPVERAKAQAIIVSAEVQAEVQRTVTDLSAIIAEANSSDRWTSRARPAFMYVVYVFILAALPMGVLYAFEPAYAERIATGVNKWLTAFPDQLYWLFGAGYLGYTGARSFDKWRGAGR